MEKYIDPGRLQRGDVIGRGAFGQVQRGKLLNQAGTWQDVAIKQSASAPASPPSSSGPTPNEQFVKEVSVTVGICGRAKHVVQCIGWSVVGEGQFALVMKLYDKSMYALIEEQVGDALPLMQVVKLGLDISRGLLELHTERIVFEDLKPHNVLLDAEGNAFLADFGLSKPIIGKDLSRVYTSSAGGTYLFMAPEKLRPPSGDKLRIGFASDVWAFGITMLQLLCSDTAAPYGRGIDLPNIIMMLMVDRQAPQVPAVPGAPELQHTLQACLSLDYNARPSAARLVQAFEGIYAHLQSAISPSDSASAAAARENETLKAQLQALGLKSAADKQRAVVAEKRAAAAERQLARAKEQHRQEMARLNHLLEQKTAEAAAQEQQVQQLQHQLQQALGNSAVSLNKANHLLKQKTAEAAAGEQQVQQLQQQLQQTSTNTIPAPDESLLELQSLLQLLDNPTCSAKEEQVQELQQQLQQASNDTSAVPASPPLQLLSSPTCSGVEKQQVQQPEQQLQLPSNNTAAAPSMRPLRLISSPTCSATLTGHSDTVTSVAFTPDGATLVSGSKDQTIKLWDVGSCFQPRQPRATLIGHTKGVLSMAVSRDGRTLASGSDDSPGFYQGTVRLWDLGSCSCTATLRNHTECSSVHSVAISPDGATVASGSEDFYARLWDTRSGSCKALLQGHNSPVYCVAFSADGARLASGGEYRDNTVRIWDVSSASCVAIFEHTSYVNSVVFSQDGAAVLSGSDDNTIRVWDARTGTSKSILEHESCVYSVALTPDGAYAVSGSADQTIKVWDWRGSGECVATLQGHADGVSSVAVSPDGRRLASGSWDNTVKLWQIAE